MNANYSLIAILLGLVLRLALPVAITVVPIYFLQRLDTHWQEEAEAELERTIVDKVQCWELKGCSSDSLAACPAPASSLPCWQAKRLPNGYLREECLSCVIFRDAPARVAHAHV